MRFWARRHPETWRATTSPGAGRLPLMAPAVRWTAASSAKHGERACATVTR